jgi:hypothetical protein
MKYLVSFCHCKVYSRGLKFSKLDGIKTEIDRFLQKSKFLLFVKCLKIIHLLSICIQNLRIKQRKIYADSKFVEMGPKQSSRKL